MSKVQGIYDGYLQNYSQKDGSLVTLSKTEAKDIAAIKKEQQNLKGTDVLWINEIKTLTTNYLIT